MLARFLLITFNFTIVVSLIAVFSLAFLFYRYGQDLPDYKQLVDYEHPVATEYMPLMASYLQNMQKREERLFRVRLCRIG